MIYGIGAPCAIILVWPRMGTPPKSSDRLLAAARFTLFLESV